MVRRGHSSCNPRQRHHASNSAPAIRKRVPARSSAGISAAPMRIAVYVEPQKKYTLAKASTMVAVGTDLAGARVGWGELIFGTESIVPRRGCSASRFLPGCYMGTTRRYGSAQVKLAASLLSPEPLYFATLG